MASKRALDMTLTSLKTRMNRTNPKCESVPADKQSCSFRNISDSLECNERITQTAPIVQNASKDVLHNDFDCNTDDNSDYEDNEEFVQQDQQDVQDFLATWSLRHNATHASINELLVYFKNHFPHLPRDARTLLKTPKIKAINKCEPGEYIHIGLKSGLDKCLESQLVLPDEIKLNFNIDGLPLAKSSTSCFWPILCKTNIAKPIIVVGLYHGYNQPKDFNLFLRLFVDELKELMTQYIFNNKCIRITINVFILDAVARAHVLGVKGHSGYFGCNRCTQEGEYYGRVTFPEMDAPKRTNESFREKLDDEYHHHESILEELNMDLVDQFSLDFLHLALLGVMKKKLKMWTSGTIESLLPAKCIQHINALIEGVSLTQPSDFQRRVQPLSRLSFYKGTELRTFLLYVGPFVLRNALTVAKYNHFMLLHTGISLLCKPQTNKEEIDFARQLLREYVTQMKLLYGLHHIVFNVHCLTHIADDVEKFGPLDSISSFEFESFMGQLKRKLRKKHLPLSQIYNRIAEINSIDSNVSPGESYDSPVLKRPSFSKATNETCYHEIQLENYKINNTERNCWLLLNELNIIKFIYAVKRDDQIYILASEIKNKSNFFDYPVKSSHLNIFKTDMRESSPKYWNLKDVKSKLFVMNKFIQSDIDDSDEDEDYYSNEYNYSVFFPILHSNI